MRLLDVLPADVVERPVPGFCDNGEERPVASRMTLGHVRDFGFVDGSNAAGIRDQDRMHQRLAIADPVGSGHLAVAVQGVCCGIHAVEPDIAPGQHRRDAGAHRSVADFQGAAAANDRRVADEHSRYIRDGIQRSGRQHSHGDAKIADTDPGILSGRRRRECEEDQQQSRERFHEGVSIQRRGSRFFGTLATTVNAGSTTFATSYSAA